MYEVIVEDVVTIAIVAASNKVEVVITTAAEQK